MKKIVSFYFLILILISCSTDIQETNDINLKNLNVSPDLETLTFQSTFEFGYDNQVQLNDLLKEYIGYLFEKQDSKDEELLGFEITINKTKTLITPLNAKSEADPNFFLRSAACPDGYTNLGVCYSADYVQNKISAYFADHSDDFENGSEISFVLVNSMGGKRVCARTTAQ